MKYFLDTEFIEGAQTFLFSKSAPTIDLISIGIVTEDGREFYAISKEFNLKEAWDRYEIDKTNGAKTYWLRENVLKGIFAHFRLSDQMHTPEFTFKNMKSLLQRHGMTRKEIADGIIDFVRGKPVKSIDKGTHVHNEYKYQKPEFYGYFADYDWVAFCWLFGKMINLPLGFPMYCIDLKQMMDFFGLDKNWKEKNHPNPPGEHNALVDARWNKELFDKMKFAAINFLNKDKPLSNEPLH